MSNLQNNFPIVHIEQLNWTGVHILMKLVFVNNSFPAVDPFQKWQVRMLDKENKLGEAAGKPSSQNQPQRAHPKVKR